MQSIGFNEHYRLQTAVFEEWKTMTRRLEKGLENLEEGNFSFNKNKGEIKLYCEKGSVIEVIKSRYKIGEVVAVKLSYKDCIDAILSKIAYTEDKSAMRRKLQESGGWNNKMFVRADLMPRHIRITDIKVERLQDISDDDCLKEGILRLNDGDPMDGYFFYDRFYNIKSCYNTPRLAFASLIDKVSGKGTWEKNPFCFCYEFKLIK